MKSQMEEMERTRYRGRVGGFHALHGGVAPHKSPRVHQPGSSLNPVLLGFYGDIFGAFEESNLFVDRRNANSCEHS